MLKLIKNIWNSPKTSAQGAAEAATLGGFGALLASPDQLKLVALLALWRLFKGLLSTDARKVFDSLLEADRKEG